MTTDLNRVANKVVNDCLRIKPGEYFWISCADDYYFKFCEEVAIEAVKAGAHPHISISSDRIFMENISQTTDFLKEPASFASAITEVADVHLQVVFPRNPGVSGGLDPHKLAAMSSAGRSVQEIVYKKNKDTVKQRKASFLYPTPEAAASYGISYEIFADMVWRSLDIDYEALRMRAKKIAGIMKNSDKVYITNPEGTNLEFSIKGRPPFIDDGVFDEEDFEEKIYMMNLPTGEVCVAPVEDSANGVAYFKFNRFMGRDLKNLKFEFKNGKVVNIEGEEGAEYYKSILDNQTGNKDMIAELGIGLNPEINRVLGELALDEKIIGTIHIATGENRMLHGKGVSSFHYDLVMDKPTLKFDNTLIMENGEYRV
ncbi:MAG: aminopeptidase [Firmicutes bacterium]|nr:aminopeptidase [Bacillota bacterium]